MGYKAWAQGDKPFIYWLANRDPLSSNLSIDSTLESVNLSKIHGVKIKNKLGEGKFGQVYLGSWEGTEVALKILKDATNSKEFTQEAAMLL
jgi:predicted Ser/Thr protein kinase